MAHIRTDLDDDALDFFLFSWETGFYLTLLMFFYY